MPIYEYKCGKCKKEFEEQRDVLVIVRFFGMQQLFERQLQQLSLRADGIVNTGDPVFRIGFGYDAHRFVEERPLIVGGVEIPHSRGLKGHSDADVLTHAVIDAILGALAMGDIGRHFPDSDPAYKDIDSLLMLEKVMGWVKGKALRVNNIDTTVVAEKPKLAPYVMRMQERFSEILEIPKEQINIKATTSEGMGFCGRQEGMEAYAVVSLIGVDGR